jgi:glyceraldehyde 3-phosphate dehydrogenase (phosphorylating)
MIKIGINGFGRIGRVVFRIMAKSSNFQVVAINDLLDVDTLAYFLKYDTVFGKFDGTIEVKDGQLVVNGQTIRVSAERNPADINWGALNVDTVVESTGFFLTQESAGAHIKAGAKKVILSAPAKDDTKMFVYGVNHNELTKDFDIISNASCTTNCFVPILKVLHENFGVVEGLMTTIHSITGNQMTVDTAGGNLRRNRAGGHNIIPTTTGAAKAATKIMPELVGKVNGMAMRVPTLDGSVVDFTVRLEKATTLDAIKAKVKEAAEGELKGVLEYTEEAIVSSDIVGNPNTSIFDADACMELNGNFFKLINWYDNEWGYSAQLVKMVEYWAGL